ncbi:MAG: NosD domain-containing protein, partial [candidate division WOR-3 bacterium]
MSVITVALILSSFISLYAKDELIVYPNQNLGSVVENLKEGSTLIIKAGTYKVDNIKITKSISIIGENFPIIEGNNKDEVFTITANNVTITGLVIKNAGVSFLQENAAIKLNEVSNCRIENNILKNNFFGIYLSKSFNCVIKNNKIE